MATYRRTPETVEAKRWFYGDAPLPGMVKTGIRGTKGPFYAIHGKEVRDGDWVLIDSHGHCRRCEPHDFDVDYELIEAEPVQ